MRRISDICLSLIGLILSLPVFVILLILGWISTRSPLFFQLRVGRHQRLFTLVKFRTMHVGTKHVATHEVQASQVTRLGHFLRRSKLDELPQLWNVLLGHMSLVGPRPCLPTQTELINQREAHGVFTARPGITGLAQVQHIDMSMPELLAETDAQMLQELSFKNYLKLIIATLLGKGSGDKIRHNTNE